MQMTALQFYVADGISLLFYAMCHKLCLIIHYLNNSAKAFWKFYKCLDFRQST